MREGTNNQFPVSVWDGLATHYADIRIDKNPDFFLNDRVTQEIQAIEQWIIDRMGVWDTLNHWGVSGSILTVMDDSSGLSWRNLIAGPGISLTYAADTITLENTGSVASVTLTNDQGSTIVIGSPVYTKASNTIALAKADAISTTEVIGLVADINIANGASGNIIMDGIFTATTAQWDVITSGAGGLIPGSRYYLSEANAGKLTTMAPTIVGDFVKAVGYALNTTQLKISIEPHIKL